LIRRIQSSHDVDQCGLSAAALTRDGQELSLPDFQVEMIQGQYMVIALMVNFGYIPQATKWSSVIKKDIREEEGIVNRPLEEEKQTSDHRLQTSD